MRISFVSCVTTFFASFLLVAPVHAASITGTVTNKTSNRPSSGDSVALIDVGAGMSEAASGTTNGQGQYSLEAPGMGPYLIRVNHQGGTYFIAAPQGGAPGDVTVYDVAPKVDGVSVDADMFLVEAAGGMLRIHERYLVRNTSLPPRAQFSDKTFEIVIPSAAEIDSASATRPGGLPTNTRLIPLSQQGHYTFNIPIQPNQGEKETLFEVQYRLPYNGKYTLTPRPQMPADNVVVYLPEGISFKGARGATFQAVQEDPKVQSYVAKNIQPGQAIEFSLAGEGQMPHQAQGASMGQPMGMSAADGAGGATGRPGGGIGEPIDTPDPLTKYKWWILSFLTILLIAASAFFLRRREATDPVSEANPLLSSLPDRSREVPPARFPQAAPTGLRMTGEPANSALLNLLKDEIFAIESERLAGKLTEEEYGRIKVGLDALLKRKLEQGTGGRA
jgi:hypothetical protein